MTIKIFSSLVRLDSSTAKNNRSEVVAILHVNFYKQEVHTETLTDDLKPLEPGFEFVRVHFSGAVNQRERSVMGQCSDEVLRYWGHIKEVSEYCRLWERWNENDKRLGTRNQNSALEGVCDIGFDDYESWVQTYLVNVGLYSDRGHVWGSETLIEVVPSEVLSKIEQVTEKMKDFGPTFKMKECVNA